MAKRQPDDEDDTLELTPDMEVDEPPEDEAEGEEEEPPEGEPTPEQQAEEEAEEEEAAGPAFDEEEADEGDNSVIRGLRERVKQLGRENEQLRTAAPAVQPQLELPEKPTLADCDYNEEEYEQKIESWHEKKARIDAALAEQTRLNEQAGREWQEDLQNYASRRDALKLPDFEDSAEAVKASLSLSQQAVIVKAAGDSAAFVYALGRAPTRMAELAKIHDPIKLAAAIARMEGGIKVKGKRKAPAPDRPQTGAAKMPGGVDKQLEKLEAEAERSGDRTELLAYRKKLKERGKK